jgi:hypothetical protein
MSKALHKLLPEGFDCTTCKTFHKLGPYVAAHWDIRLTHTCTCGAQHSVLKGKVLQIKKGKVKKS